MSKAPTLKELDLIVVGPHRTPAVVKIVYPKDSPSGVALVLFNKREPTLHDVFWDGSRWMFPERPNYGLYAGESDPCAVKLRRDT